MKTTDQFIGKYSHSFDFDKPIEDKFMPSEVYTSNNEVVADFMNKCNRIRGICLEYNLSVYCSDFQRLYNSAARINYLSNNVSHIYGDLRTFNYRNQLFDMFKVFHQAKNLNNVTIELITIGGTKKYNIPGTKGGKEPFKLDITDNNLLNEVGDLVSNEVASLYFNKTFKELSENEIESLLLKIEKWFELVKLKEKGGGLKRGYFLKIFANDILDYIDENTILINETKTLKCEFIGKLFDAFDLKSPTKGTSYSKMIFNFINAKD